MVDEHDDYLAEVLRHVRRIADLPDLAAYDELVDFVEQIRYGAEAQRFRARTELERIRAEVEAFGASLATVLKIKR